MYLEEEGERGGGGGGGEGWGRNVAERSARVSKGRSGGGKKTTRVSQLGRR